MRRWKVVLLAGVLASLAACVSLGPPFQPVAAIPAGKALVYIYRTPSFVGSAVSYTVNAGQLPVVTLYNGGYFPFITNPGRIDFWAETEASSFCIIEVQVGKTYYLKGKVQMGILVGRPDLEQVHPAMGQLEIMDCKLIPLY
jgi:hypothetical protein